LEEVLFRYTGSSFELRVRDLSMARHERCAIIGPSGSGKTTLLHLLAGIQQADAGKVIVEDVDLSRLADHERRLFRLSKIGLVFQEFELLEYLSVWENILLAYRLDRRWVQTPATREWGRHLARTLGLEGKLNRKPRQLSQGERQRVAIARALVTEPSLVLADEPTGNLDPTLKHQVLDLFLEALDRRPATLVMVTHDHSLLDRFDRVLSVDEWSSSNALPSR
jgi:putative ABC transport system ATP-binding protein